MMRTVMSVSILAGALLASGAAAQQVPYAPPAQAPAAQPAQPAKPVTGFEKGVSEYNISKDVYISGDPILMSRANMKSGARINFVACPIYQDSEPTPLWLTQYQGETYFLRAQQNLTGDVHHPQLLHRVLVEGVISNEPRIGGGIVLSPLNLSILPEIDIACNETRPASDAAVKFAKRPPGPGSDGSHREAINSSMRSMRARLDSADYKPDPVERVERQFNVAFDFSDEMVWNYAVVTTAVKYARDVGAERITIHASRGSVLTSDGKTMIEEPDLPRRRALAVERIVTDYPIPKSMVTTTWDEQPAPADGVADFANRYVTVTIYPPAAKTAAR